MTDLSLYQKAEKQTVPDDLWAGRRGVRAFLTIPEGGIALALALAVILVILGGPFVAPYPPNEVAVGAPGEDISMAHPLGTDALGRDVLSRVLHGGVAAVAVPLVAIALTFVISGTLGMIAGYLGGWFDALISRVIDVVLAIPALMLVLVVMAGLGTSYSVVILAMTLVFIPGVFRVLRGAVRVITPREYVLAAKARGDTKWWIIRQEILPNIMPTFLVELALRTTWAVAFFATLSFLGLGVRPPTSNWGVMVAENKSLLLTSPITVLAPLAAIAVLAIAINMIADALTQYYGGDDRMRDIRI